MTTQLVEDLTTARDLIAAGRWVQGEYARPVKGVACFCAVGAIKRAVGLYTDQIVSVPACGVEGCCDPEERVEFTSASCGPAVDRQMVATDALAEVLPAPATVADPDGTDSDVVVIRWNDIKGRTRKQVVAAFDRAIEQASR